MAATVASVRAEKGDTALVKLTYSAPVDSPWAINDLVCLSRAKRNNIVCGRVAQFDPTSTTIRLSRANAQYKPGEELKVLYSKSKRSLASTGPTGQSGQLVTGRRTTNALTTIGMGTGFSYLIFQGQFQVGLGRRFSMGLTVPYASTSSGESSITSIGAVLTANFYLVERFTGYNFEMGVGKYSLTRENQTLKQTANETPITFFTTFGWKGLVNRGRFNIGAAGGFNYVGSDPAVFDFSGLMPLIALSFGVEF